MHRIGLVGAGFAAAEHAARYDDVDGAELVGVCARSAPTEFVAAHAPGATAYEDLDALLAAVDAVDVCTPTDTHRDVVTRAAAAGVDVLCEKPLARTLADARAVEDAVEAAGVTCSVGFVVRHAPPYRLVHDRVAAGDVGDPGVARATRRSPFPEWGRDGWLADRERSGGVVLDLGSHDFDFLRWTLGDVERVHCRRTGDGADPPEHALTTLRFGSGAVAHVESSWAAPAGAAFHEALEVAGDDGLLDFDDRAVAPVRAAGRESAGNLPDDPLTADAFDRELAAFVDALDGERAPVGPAEATASLRVALAALASADRGEPVAPAEVTA